MYKIIIVEDEPFVRRSIKMQMDWNAMGFTLVGEAGNGEEAIRLIEMHQPNLILCDIVMPIMDGLELLKYCKEKDNKGKFVMLTCMNEFEYARQALKYGASEYILKLSMNKEDLLEVLMRIKQELDREQLEWSSALFYKYKVMYEKIWKGILEDYADGASNQDQGEFPDDWEYVSIAVSIKGDIPWDQEMFEVNFLEEGMEGAYLHTFTSSGVQFGFYWSEHPVRFKRKLPQLPCETIVLSPSIKRDKMLEQWKQMLHSLSKFWYEGKSGTYYAAKDMDNVFGLSKLSWDDERKWLELFENMDELSWRQQGQDVFNRLKDLRAPMFAVKQLALRMDHAFRKIAGIDGDHNIKEPLPELEYSTSHDECLNAMLERMSAYQEWRMAYTVITTNHDEINKIIRVIHNQYDKPITLQAMAHYVNMDAHYLSKLFKKKTGETLINYLQQQRIARAKQYLTETSNPINEIGFLVGFANDNYFVKVFKRWTGVTPGSYRRSNKKA